MRKIYFLIFFLMSVGQFCLAQNFIEVGAVSGISGDCGECDFGAGLSFMDFNSDGLDDLTFATQQGINIAFFQNTGNGFMEIIPPPIVNTDENKQVVWIDFDNDGDKDFFVANFNAPDRLYENDGNFNFTDITVEAGIPITNDGSWGGDFGDYNNDGLLDLYISNYSTSSPNKLFKNNGDGTFTDVSEAAGISNDVSATFCSVFFDFNNDGFQDIYEINDRFVFANVLYKNNGDGTFVDVSGSSNTDIAIDAMNAGVADYDNDGDQDIYVTNLEENNQLLRNNGDETFTDVATQLGVGVFNKTSWGGNFFDLDNDMDLDLYVSNNENSPTAPFVSSDLFINDFENGVFVNIDPPGMAGDTAGSHSNAIADFNLDGLLDIAVNNSHDGDDIIFDFHLWQNTTSNSNNWLKVFLVGTESNRDGIGSLIEFYVEGNKYIRYKHCNIAYVAQNSTLGTFWYGLIYPG